MAEPHPTLSPEELQTEIWTPVSGYETRYSISNLGRLRSESRKADVRGRIIRPFVDKNGYLKVNLRGDQRRNFFIHQLVAWAFVGAQPRGLVINHIDHNSMNNRAENLEYITQGENVRKAIAAGRCDHINRSAIARANAVTSGKAIAAYYREHPEMVRRGEANNKAKLTEDQVREIRTRYATGTIGTRPLAALYGVSRNTITWIVKGRNWAHVK